MSRGVGNSTTRYRRFEKKLARFCDFLLTQPTRGLILRIQIRVTWKRQADRVGGLPGSALPTLQPGITVKNEREVFRSAEFVGRRSQSCSAAWQSPPARAAHSLFAVVSGWKGFQVTRDRAAAPTSGAQHPLSDKGVN